MLLAFASVFSLTACLNSKVGGGGNRHEQSTNARGISPIKVELNWNEDFSEKTYEVYEASSQDQVLATTRFGQVTIPVVQDQLYDFRVFRILSNSAEKSKAFEFDGVKSWAGFEDVELSSHIEEFFPTTVTWNYEPWTTGLKASSAIKHTTIAECAFLKNGLNSDDPFTNPLSKVLKRSAFDEKVIDSGCKLEPNADYLVACRIKYADGHVSTSTLKANLVSPSECIKSEEALPYFSVDAIQPSPYLGFSIINATGGLFSWALLGYDYDAPTGRLTEKTIDSNAQNYISELINVVYSTPLNHFGLGRVRATFKPSTSSVTQQVIPKDFYIKTLDEATSVIFPPIIDAGSPMSMGNATSVGDYDCDGIDDLAIGMKDLQWRDDSSGAPVYKRTGAVVVFYGEANRGLKYKSAVPSTNPAEPGVGAPRPPLLILPPDFAAYGGAGIQFGYSLTTGNFNRDVQYGNGYWAKCDDLVIGAPYVSIETPGWAGGSAGGAVFITYGGPSGLKSNWAVSHPNTPFNGSCAGVNPVVPDGQSAPPSMNLDAGEPAFPRPIRGGSGVCTGTVLYPLGMPVLIGASNAASPFYFGATESTAGYKAERNNVFLISGQGTMQHESRSSGFGMALGAGDFDGDGYDDLIVGAPQTQRLTPTTGTDNKPSTSVNVGAALLYFGGASGVRQYVDTSWNGPTAVAGVGSQNSIYRATALFPNSSTTTHISPIKFAPGRSMITSSTKVSMNFGTSVAIGRLKGTPTGNTANQEVYTRHRGATNLNFGASVFIGAPGYSYTGAYDAGAVAHASWTEHFWSTTSAFETYTQPSMYFETADDSGLLRFDIEADVLGIKGLAGSLLINPEVVNASNVAQTVASGARFGASLAVGSFRPIARTASPNATIDFGLDPYGSSPINQVLAIGAPGYNSSTGVVYLVNDAGLDYGSSTGSKQSSVGGFDLKSGPLNSEVTTGYTGTVVGKNFAAPDGYTAGLCADPSDCAPIKRVDPFGFAAGASFGSSLGMVRKPLNFSTCGNTPGQCTADNQGKMFFRKGVEDLDVLLVGAPGAQKVALYTTTQDTGMTLASSNLDKTSVYTGNMTFGANVTGGYFKSRADFYSVVASAPTRALPVAGSGDVFIYEPTGSSLPATPTSLVQNVKGTGTVFNIGSEVQLGFNGSTPVGDVNCDGYSDVILKMGYGGSPFNALGYRLVVLYGSSAGLVTTGLNANYNANRDPMNPKSPQWLVPAKIGLATEEPASTFVSGVARNVYGVGDINGDGCDDLVYGNNNVYTFFGSPSGLVADRSPSRTLNYDVTPPSGSFDRTPQYTEMPNDGFTATNMFANGYFQAVDEAAINGANSTNLRYSNNALILTTLPTAKNSITSGEGDGSYWNGVSAALPHVCHGDFNGDGFMDMVTSTTQAANFGAIGYVTSNGTQSSIIKSTDATYRMNGYYTVYYGSEYGLQYRKPADANQLMGSCKDVGTSSASKLQCKISRLFHPSQFVKEDYEATDADSRYFFPIFQWQESFLRISATQTASDNVPYAGVILDNFGTGCLSTGDLDGDGADDLAVPLPQKKSLAAGSSFLIFWGKRSSGPGADESLGLNQKRSNFVRLVKGTVESDGVFQYTADSVSTLNASAFTASSSLGRSGAGVGDVNGDGLNDIVLGAPGDNAYAVIFGGRHLKHRDFTGSPQTSITDEAATKFYHGGSDKMFSGAGGYCAGTTEASECYERWVKVLTVDHYGTSQACEVNPDPSDTDMPSCVALHHGQNDFEQRAALRVVYTGSSSDGFGNSVQALGDMNSDGHADFALNTAGYDHVSQNDIGGAVIYFGGQIGVHTKSSPSQVARCMGDDRDTFAGVRDCIPYRVLPKFASESFDGIQNDIYYSGQAWQLRSSIQFRTKKNRLEDPNFEQYRGTNLGSRVPGSLVDTKSTDFLMCVSDNFKSNRDPDRIRTGACGVYY